MQIQHRTTRQLAAACNNILINRWAASQTEHFQHLSTCIYTEQVNCERDQEVKKELREESWWWSFNDWERKYYQPWDKGLGVGAGRQGDGNGGGGGMNGF